MKQCVFHSGIVQTAEEASRLARTILYLHSPAFAAEVITKMDGDHPCCPASGYARYLLMSAFRHELRELS